MRADEPTRAARTCYDHVAGRLGVSVAEALERRGWLAREDEAYRVTPAGERELGRLGIDVAELRRGSRPLVRPCLDWTERRPHVAGAVGAALARRLFELGWIERVPGGRAVRVTDAGAGGLRRELGVSA
jgi:ribosomal protein S19E (S16A)